MNPKKSLLTIILLLSLSVQVVAQLPKNYKAEIEVNAIGTSNNVVPFWMRSNQYGSIPIDGVSGGLLGRISKQYSDKDNERKLTDWAFGFEGRANAGNKTNLTIIEAYLKGRLGVFQIQVGRSKDVMGLNGDTSLSSGNFAVSGNALGIPKLEISIPEYYTPPILGDIFSFKGNFSNGIVGKFPVRPRKISTFDVNTYFHQKSFYARLGKPDWKLHLYGGFNHQVYWGDEKKSNGEGFTLSPTETFFYAITGKAYGNDLIETSKVGNHGGSIDLGFQYEFENFNIMVYRQNFYEVGALSKFANIKDGLNGLTISNKKLISGARGFQWKKILAEFFYSKDQAGYPNSIRTKSGDEDYYNNYFYVNGYSYKQQGLGNPLITPAHNAREGQAIHKDDYFINNRVVAFHLGIEGEINNLTLLSKVTYSNNYGTFGTSVYGKTLGSPNIPDYSNLFKPVKQLSVYIEANKELKNKLNIGAAAALDNGKLLDNSVGLILKIKKSF